MKKHGHPPPLSKKMYNAIECADFFIFKFSGILVHHGTETDVTRFHLDEARAFLVHIKRSFGLNFQKRNVVK